MIAPYRAMPAAKADHAKPVPAAQPVAQLAVKKQKAGHWYSDYDPYRTFPTKAAAQLHDKKLKKDGATGSLHFRVPTLYTYAHTRVTSKLSRALQGPHTVAHRLTLRALQAIKTMDDVRIILDDQVLEPDDVDEVMTEEGPQGGYAEPMKGRVDRYKQDYRTIHGGLSAMLTPAATVGTAATTITITDGKLRAAKHRLNQLLNLDPYATYGWKSATKAGRKALKGKGENKPLPSFDDLFDRPKATSIRNSDALESFIRARRKLFDLHFT